MMQAVLQHAYGPADQVLVLGEVEPPVLGDHDVRVRVQAASVHADVWHVVTGLPYVIRLASGLRGPRHPVPGTDVAGIVEEVGASVTRFSPGHRVFGATVRGFHWKNGGAYAELAAVPEGDLEPIPEGITFEQAASVPTSGLIAWLNLGRGKLVQPGHRVLINGAAGNVGSIALQIAKARGAVVTAVDRGDKLALVHELGADEVVDYRFMDVTRFFTRYDVVCDVASTLRLAQVKRILAGDGVYVRIGHEHYGAEGATWFGQLGSFLSLVARSPFDKHLPALDGGSMDGGLAVLREMLEAGTLTPVVDRVFGLHEVAAAIAYLESGHARGRVVVRL